MSLSPLVGHTALQETLYELLQSGKFPHALLLHGEEGIGKRLLAETIGRMLLCDGSLMQGRLNVRTEHVLYPQIEAGACPDYLVLEKEEGAASIKVEQVRGLLEKLSLTSDGKRVVIVDAADDLGVEAANALLKTLEEPGKNIHFILLAHNLFRLLPTILSRCRKMRVAPLSEEETLSVLQRQPELDGVSAAELAGQYPGSPGQALRLGTEGLEIRQAVLAVLAGQQSAAALADKYHQSKQTDLLLSLLLKEIAARQTPAAAETYQAVQQLAGRSRSHNLSGNWVVEEALRLASL